MITEKETEFLKESNAIEGEYSEEALEDAIEAWKYAKKCIQEGLSINIEIITIIHNKLMKRLNQRIAGKIREVQVYVGSQANGYRECLNHKKIHTALLEWSYIGNKRFLFSPKDIAVNTIEKIHVEFEKIHPFEDGNGRVGRILMNLQRLQSGMSILIIHEGREQMEYYKWFKHA